MSNSHTTLEIPLTREEKLNLKLRVNQAVAQLPKMILPFYTHFFPETISDEDKEKVRNVIQGRAVDKIITEKLEKLVELIKI